VKHLALRTRFGYDEATGLLTERSLPANPAGGDAHTTKTIYWTAGANSQDATCGNKARYANLPCKVMPVKQLGAEGPPELLVTRYAKYSPLDEPEEIVESPGGKEVTTRITIMEYDAGGRETGSEQVGGGTALPPTRTTYSASNGQPVEQRFVCKSKCRSGPLKYASSIGSSGSGEGQLSTPQGITIGEEGNIWVADSSEHRVVEFNEAGEYRNSFGSFGSGNGQFSYPNDLAIDAKGNIWVADPGANRVQEFNSGGDYIGEIEKSQLFDPDAIAIASGSHNIWIADTLHNCLKSSMKKANSFVPSAKKALEKDR
jgi:hypothetical protein